ncbi:UNVERIFIED_CONTAM: hypothetical protein Scaly_0859800 [Sesamum calycinum]|uniref:RNase H type-1 domain-containing protein n=1 Tax=Sesamum calycinum TaxID=2727403 RepID=A0AAW2QVD6_9LAMI
MVLRYPFTTSVKSSTGQNVDPSIEKMALTLVITARKLRLYFLSYPVRVRTNYSPKASPRQTQSIGTIRTTQEEVPEERPWLLHVDRSSTTQRSGAGVVITSPQEEGFAIKFYFKASNNEAEYEALVLGIRMAQDVGALHLLAYSDSQLIVKQVNGETKPKKTAWKKACTCSKKYTTDVVDPTWGPVR